MYYKRILTFMFPVLYSPNETVYFLGFFTSRRHIFMCNRADPDADPDPKHWVYWVQSKVIGTKNCLLSLDSTDKHNLPVLRNRSSSTPEKKSIFYFIALSKAFEDH